MTTCFLAPDPIQSTFFIPGGAVPGNGVQLGFFANLSSTPTTVYKDPLGATPHTNPIVLDSGGNIPSGAEVWIPQGVLVTAKYAPANDAFPPVSPYRTLDNLSGINDTSFFQSAEWVVGATPSFVNATQFTMVGDQTLIFQIGRKLKATVTAGFSYSRIASASFGGGLTTVTIVPDPNSVALDAGLSAVSYSFLSATNPSVPLVNFYADQPAGRLTLSSGVAITVVDVTSATLFFTPYRGNLIELFDGTYWNKYNFVEASIAVPAISSQAFDVFARAVSSSVQLSSIAWTNDTTRATPISSQNGVFVNSSGALRYLGSYATNANAVAEDSYANRLLSNFNAVERELYFQSTTTTWNSTSGVSSTPIPVNQQTSNRLNVMIGLSERPVEVKTVSLARAITSGTGSYISGVGLDNTSAFSAKQTPVFLPHISTMVQSIMVGYGTYYEYVIPGKHFFQWLDVTSINTTVVTASNNSFLYGRIWG